MLQSRYRMHKLFDVAPEAFNPPPRVVSAVVRMVPLPESRLKPKSDKAFEQLVARAFAQRRKMLRRGLADWAGLIDWEGLGIPATERAEDLTVAQFIEYGRGAGRERGWKDGESLVGRGSLKNKQTKHIIIQ